MNTIITIIITFFKSKKMERIFLCCKHLKTTSFVCKNAHNLRQMSFISIIKCFDLVYLHKTQLLHIGCNPVHIVADLSIDARMKQTPTANAPTDNTSQVSRSVPIVTNHGSSRVTLTTVLATLSSTDHAVSNTEGVLQPGTSNISWFTYSIMYSLDGILHQNLESPEHLSRG